MSAYEVDAVFQQQLREQNDANWERFKAEMDACFARFEEHLTERISDLTKWMLFYWLGTGISLAGLMIALARK